MEPREQRRKEQNRLAQKRYRNSVRSRLRTLEQLLDLSPSKQPAEATPLAPPSQPTSVTLDTFSLSKQLYGNGDENSCLLSTSTLSAQAWSDVPDLDIKHISAAEEPLSLDNDFLSVAPDSCEIALPVSRRLQSWTPSSMDIRMGASGEHNHTPSSTRPSVSSTSSLQERHDDDGSRPSTPDDYASHLPTHVQVHAGDSPLHTAARSGKPKAVELLLAHGYEARISNSKGLTALHCAVLSGCYESAELLVHADPSCADMSDISGATPLHFAAATGQESILRLLLVPLSTRHQETDSWL